MNRLMARLTGFLFRLREGRDGQALVEYALILALVAVVVVGVLVILGNHVHHTLNNVANSIGG